MLIGAGNLTWEFVGLCSSRELREIEELCSLVSICTGGFLDGGLVRGCGGGCFSCCCLQGLEVV